MPQETYPQTVSLKQGKTVTLRLLEAGDRAKLLAFFQALPPQSTEFLKEDVRDPAVVDRFCDELDHDKVWCLLAVAPDGAIVANATLHMSARGWYRHLGEVRVVVADAYHKHGLATKMLRQLVNHASVRGLRKLEARILDSQGAARTAFEHLGFREEARLKDHALDIDGRHHDLLLLTNTVEDLWRKMEEMVMDLDLGRSTESY